jgi:hypothetical protein
VQSHVNFDAAQIPPSQAAVFVSRYGLFLVESGGFTEAEQPLREAYRRLGELGQQNSAAMRDVVGALAVLYDKTGRPEEAAARRAELGKLEAAPRPSTDPVSAPR